jgi:E3 UFM1-protein ligase 1
VSFKEYVRMLLYGDTIAGTLEGSTLYMPRFVLFAKAFFRGTLRAAVTPVSISSLLRARPFRHSSAVSTKLAVALIEELITDGAVKGTFCAAGVMFTPEVFQLAQIKSTQACFQQNRFVEYSLLKRWSVAQPKQFLRQNCPGGHELESIYIGEGIICEVCMPNAFLRTSDRFLKPSLPVAVYFHTCTAPQ